MKTQLTHRRVRRQDRKYRERFLARPAVHAGRQGSTLMIVIVLLGLLSVLGVLFYTFAAAERSNAEYYSNGAKAEEDPGLSADVLMDFALQQLIIGPDPRFKNSALWGGRHSMVPNALGTRNLKVGDLAAFDGTGVNVIFDATGAIVVDQNFDGTADVGNLLDDNGQAVPTSSSGSNVQDLLNANDSPAANGLYERQTGRFPQPDVGYTYPDLNNIFLAHVGWVRDSATNTLRRVVIPSFHRPQVLRQGAGTAVPRALWEDANYNGVLDAAEDLNSNGDDFNLANPALDTFKNRQFRPHPGHLYVPPNVQGATQTKRYVTTRNEAMALFGDGKRVFPFLPMYPGYNPTDNTTDVTLTGRPANWVGNQGVWSATNGLATIDDIQFDMDNDGDSLNEGILVDLDFPVQELADGTLFVPMFSFTVYDQNGLLDLNSHGNIQQLLFNHNPDTMASAEFPFDNLSGPFGTNSVTAREEFISASNQGMRASEINPAWGFTTRPGFEVPTANLATVFAQHQLFYGNLPRDATTLPAPPMTDQQTIQSWRELANMELVFTKMGRPQLNSATSIDDLHPGVYGEEHLIAPQITNPPTARRNPQLFPHPGASVSDDNNDLSDGMTSPPQYAARGISRIWLDVDQPFDALGAGWSTASYGGSPKAFDLINPVTPSSKLLWPRFYGYTSNGNVLWGDSNVASGSLLPASASFTLTRQANAQFDDPDEQAFYAKDGRDVDDALPPLEAAYLHMSDADVSNIGLSARLQELAKVNFSGTDNSRGEQIRKRFTTVSNDRKNFAIPRAPGVGGRNWEWTDDQGRTAEQLQAAGQANTVKLRFPPTFGDAPVPQNSPTSRYGSADPFRPAVRFLLQTTRDDLSVTKQYQQRLSVNQLLTFNNQSKKLEYRDLTPHVLNPGSTTIPTAQPAYPPQTVAQYEYWARRDRQQLARDIYVLLYLLGPAPATAMSSTDNPTRTTWTAPYTTQQLEQMARFAVNLVDAQDRDNVITRFEYDTNLADGWGLDDNPYTTSEGGAQRAEVWGVERQELTFSEAIAIETAAEMSNKGQTSWDDQTARQFLCVELRNLVPYDVKFTDEEEAWQLVIRQYEPTEGSYDPTKERQITLRNNAGYVKASGFYTLFTTDQNEPSSSPTPSVMQVDPDGASGLTPIVPNVLTSDPFVTGSASAITSHIDLVEDAVTSGQAFTIKDGNGLTLTGTAGAALQHTTPGTFILDSMGGRPAHIILRRRAHPTRAKPTVAAEELDNPWVEVDRIALNMKTFNYPDSGSDATTELTNMQSTERGEPLDRGSEGLTIAPMAGYAYNTFGNNLTTSGSAENSRSSAQLLLRQTHPDRQFVSMGEVLHVPLVGPPPNILPSGTFRTDGLTTYFASLWQPPELQYQPLGFHLPAAPYFENYAKSAIGMFAVSDSPGATPDNRWHRVLEFLEIPSRQSRNLGLGSEFDIARVAGRVNLNTLRHPEVLAGMIDDEFVADLDLWYPSTVGSTINDSNYPQLLDKFEPAARDWFVQLLRSRDQKDPYQETQSNFLRLPGLPIDNTTNTGRPFRSFSFAEDTLARTPQNTLLRSLPADVEGGAASNRQLLEVGLTGDHYTGGVTPLDPALKQRILSKMWNNTTTRSNSFVVFISAKLFRANIDPTTGAVRIGGPLRELSATDASPELPEYRGVFVVDRSDLEGGGLTSGAGLTSFRPFVKYRRIIQDQ